MKLGKARQLFFDDALIEAQQGLLRRWHRPVRHPANPVLTTGQEGGDAWEEGMPICFGSVLFDVQDGVYKLWYGLHEGGGAADAASVLAYATSQDGLAWKKPALGLFDYRGTSSNHIVRTRDGLACSVIKDGRAAADVCYKMLYCDAAMGVSAARSRDGLRWSEYAEHNPVIFYPPGHDSQNVLYWDEQLEKYVAIVRERRGKIAAVRPQILKDERARQSYHRLWRQWPDKKSLRRIGQCESDDLVNWSPLRTILAADEDDPLLRGEFYNMQVMQYEGVRVGFITVFSYDDRFCRGAVQLAFSRDGMNWCRPDPSAPFLLPSDLPGDFDWGSIYPLQAPLVVGDRIWIYYNGVGVDHNHEPPSGIAGFPNGIGLATLRLDGFASMEASSRGTLITRAFICSGGTLAVNADAGRGSVCVAVLDEDGRPMPSFGEDECEPLGRDDVDQIVTWRGASSLEALSGKVVRLRFHLERAGLFSFQLK